MREGHFPQADFSGLMRRGTRIPSGLPTIRSESLSPLRTDELNRGGPKIECQSTVKRSTPSRATFTRYLLTKLFERRLRHARIHDLTPSARPGMTYKLDSGTCRCRGDQFSDRVRL
jgi:hypothetical protein